MSTVHVEPTDEVLFIAENGTPVTGNMILSWCEAYDKGGLPEGYEIEGPVDMGEVHPPLPPKKPDVEEYMKKRGLTDEDLDKMAAPYERGDYELSEGGEVHLGSHLDAANDGKTVTDEMIAGWESALERDEWPEGWANVGDVVKCETPDERLCKLFGTTLEQVEADAKVIESGDLSSWEFGEPVDGLSK